MIKVVSKKVALTAFSVPGFPLPTFSTGITKTVYWKWWFIRIPIRRYLMFTYIATIPGLNSKHLAATQYEYDRIEYLKHFIRTK